MTGKTIKTDQPLMGKKRTKKKSLIGIDPLAWMKDEISRSDPITIEPEEIVVSEQEVDQKFEPEIVEVIDDEVFIEELSVDIINQDTREIKDEEVTDMEISKDEGSFKLEGPNSIADVAELHEHFKTYLTEGGDLEVDCSEVEGVDAAALQLLTAFINEVEKQDNKLIWKEPSESLQAAVHMMGLKNEFKM